MLYVKPFSNEIEGKNIWGERDCPASRTKRIYSNSLALKLSLNVPVSSSVAGRV